MTTKTKLPPVKSLNDLYQKALGDDRYQRLCIVALSNLGCDHLATARKRWHPHEKWKAYHAGLLDYVSSLVGEYGESENNAFKSVVDEVNCVRDCVDQVYEPRLW